MKENVRALLLTPWEASYRDIHSILKQALKKAGIETTSLQDLAETGLVTYAVTDTIRASDLIVADVSETNPNVLYELGFAYALRKTTLLIVRVDAAKDVPLNLAVYPVIYYDLDDLETLGRGLLRFVRSQTSRLQGAEASV